MYLPGMTPSAPSESRVPSSTSPQFRAQCSLPGYIYRAQCSSPGFPSRLPALSLSLVSIPTSLSLLLVATFPTLPSSPPLPFPTAQPVTWHPSPPTILSGSTFLRIVGSSPYTRTMDPETLVAIPNPPDYEGPPTYWRSYQPVERVVDTSVPDELRE